MFEVQTEGFEHAALRAFTTCVTRASTGRPPRSFHHAILTPVKSRSRRGEDVPGSPSEIGDRRSGPAIALRTSARSATRRAIGPSTLRVAPPSPAPRNPRASAGKPGDVAPDEAGASPRRSAAGAGGAKAGTCARVKAAAPRHCKSSRVAKRSTHVRAIPDRGIIPHARATAAPPLPPRTSLSCRTGCASRRRRD